MNRRSLRPYQQSLVEQIDAAWASGARNVCAVSPTGSGKTVLFGHILAREQGAVVAIAHRNELVSQMSVAVAREGVRHRVIGPAALQRECAKLHLAELGRSFYDHSARAAVAGVDTLCRMSPDESWFSQVSLWVCDEQHHLLADNKWGRAVSMFPNARGLGVTATPLRADGKGLGRHADGVADVMVVGPSMRDLIKQGFLTDYRIFAPKSGIDLARVSLSAGGDYNPAQLREERHRARIEGDVVTHYARIAGGRLGVTFDVDIESAGATAEAYRAAGIAAEVISGNTPPALRSSILARFRRREILQVVSVDILGEGFDLPAIEVVSMARPTESFAVYAQQFGRALRPLEGKTHAIVIDHVGNTLRHGLPDTYREWSLDRRERRSRATVPDATPVRSCQNAQCAAVYERVLPACPYCGHEPVPAQRSAPEFVDGDLLELDAETLSRLRGEVRNVHRDVPLLPVNAAPEVVGAIRKRHAARLAAQQRLKDAIALWAGWQRHLSRGDAEIYRRFYHSFGLDIGGALTLSADDADMLTGKIQTELQRFNVICHE